MNKINELKNKVEYLIENNEYNTVSIGDVDNLSRSDLDDILFYLDLIERGNRNLQRYIMSAEVKQVLKNYKLI